MDLCERCKSLCSFHLASLFLWLWKCAYVTLLCEWRLLFPSAVSLNSLKSYCARAVRSWQVLPAPARHVQHRTDGGKAGDQYRRQSGSHHGHTSTPEPGSGLIVSELWPPTRADTVLSPYHHPALSKPQPCQCCVPALVVLSSHSCHLAAYQLSRVRARAVLLRPHGYPGTISGMRGGYAG